MIPKSGHRFSDKIMLHYQGLFPPDFDPAGTLSAGLN
jgi:hypothetical protein